MKRTDYIDDDGRIYVCCTRREALQRTSNPRPGLRPLSAWTNDERANAALNKIGEIANDICPACGKIFKRRVSSFIVGCAKCEPGTLEIRGLEEVTK